MSGPGDARNPPPEPTVPVHTAPLAEPQRTGDHAVGEPAAEPSVPGTPALPSTGDAPVDEALESLVGVLDRPLAEQLDRYADVNRRLQDRLADLDG